MRFAMRVVVLGIGYGLPSALLIIGGVIIIAPILLTRAADAGYTTLIVISIAVSLPLLTLGILRIHRARSANTVLQRIAQELREGVLGEEGWLRGVAVLWRARKGRGIVLREGVDLTGFAAVVSKDCGVVVAPAMWRNTMWGGVIVLRLACRGPERVEGRLQVIDPQHGAAVANVLLSRGEVEGRVELRGGSGLEATLSLLGVLEVSRAMCRAEKRLVHLRTGGMEAFRHPVAPREEVAVVGLENRVSVGEVLRILKSEPPYIACMACGEYRARLRIGARFSELRLVSTPCGV